MSQQPDTQEHGSSLDSPKEPEDSLNLVIPGLSPDMDFRKIQMDLLRAMRGHRSQNQINRKLGYKYNQFSKWESGRSLISWKDFVSFLEMCGTEMAIVLFRTDRFRHDPQDDAVLVEGLLRSVAARVSTKTLGVTARQFARLLKGKQILRLVDVLKLFQISGLVPQFILVVAEETETAGLEPYYEHYLLLRNYIAAEPDSYAVIAALHTQAAKATFHQLAQACAKVTGFSETRTQEVVQHLVDLGILRRVDDHCEFSKHFGPLFGGDWDLHQKYFTHWLDFALDRFSLPGLPGPTGHSAIRPVSEKAWVDAVNALQDGFAKASRIINEDTGPKTEVIFLASMYIPIRNRRMPGARTKELEDLLARSKRQKKT